uniref:DUF4092 domain-containing protein n=1 Tax=Vibrio alfacsensis TaxID=1074311 RepID=UPI001F49AC6E|nr:DUF4092 domain-containing protein [Vibrio alfacsensis]
MVARTIKLTVLGATDTDNTLPVIAPIQMLTARTHYPLNYLVSAADADGDIITFALLDSPEWVNINPETGMLTVVAKPGHEREDAYLFKVQVSDGKGYSESSISLKVVYAEAPEVPEFSNSLPNVTNIPALRIESNKTISHRVIATDADEHTLTFSIQDKPHWVSINALSGLIKVEPEDVHIGTHNFSVIVTDGYNDIVKPLQIEVTEEEEAPKPQNAPLVQDIPQLTVKIGQEKTYRVRAYDKDGDILSYEILNKPSWLFIDHNIGLIIASPDNKNYIGSHEFVLVVSDGYTKVTKSINISVEEADAPVLPENKPPVIEVIPDILMKAEHSASHRVTASDEDGDTLIYSMGTPKSWIAIHPRSGMMSFNPTLIDVGAHDLTVQVNDGKDTVSKAFSLTVERPSLVPDDNEAPVVAPIAKIDAIAGQIFAYRVQASDIDGDAISYALIEAPSWVTIDAEGIMDITPETSISGNFTFKVVVSDGDLTTETGVTITVREASAPVPVKYHANLLISGKRVSGDVECNNDDLSDGKFIVDETEFVSCHFGAVHLGDLEPKKYTGTGERPDITTVNFNLDEYHGINTENATKVLQSISTCSSLENICLSSFDSIDIETVFTNLENNSLVDEFVAAKSEEATDSIDKAPSSHVDTAIVPVISPGGSSDLNAGFVSSSAEESLTYKPSLESQVLTTSVLTDHRGIPLSGVSYFSNSARGITNDSGELEYRWGETITFGIETFTFGSVKGNQVKYKLTDVTNNDVKKDNIQALIERYATVGDGIILVGQDVHDTFSLYPNVINEIINLSLPNGGLLEGTDFSLPREFDLQFEQGLAQTIDQALNKNTFSLNRIHTYSSPNDETYVSDSLNEIFERVRSFHVFNDNYGYYGATGHTRGMRTLNMSNRAFPVMMPRNDINRLIPFGEQQAWTRDGKPYIAEHASIEMPPIPVVSSDNATYGFPFVTAGEIGAGKVVFMGNSMYPSILSCPDNYWANGYGELTPNSQSKVCVSSVTTEDGRYDNGDMKQFLSIYLIGFQHNQTRILVQILAME